MSAPRLRDWQSRLQALIAERRSMPFAWGENDCCTWACDCVVATCGYDPAEGLRDHRTKEEGDATLKEHGGVRALGDARLGARIVPKLAAVGDIGMLVVKSSKALAVCAGDHWLAPGPDGLQRFPLDTARCAWRCERCPS